MKSTGALLSSQVPMEPPLAKDFGLEILENKQKLSLVMTKQDRLSEVKNFSHSLEVSNT